MAYQKIIETATGSFYLREDDIIESIPLKSMDGESGLKEAKENVSAMRELCHPNPKPLLAHLSNHSITDEARKYYMNNTCVTMTALIGSSFIARLMGNLIMNLKKPSVPVKLFKTPEEGVKWITEMRVVMESKAKMKV